MFQSEICPNTGRHHVQAYIQLQKQTTMKRMLKLMGLTGAHAERKKGTAEEARKYCMKEDSRMPHTTPCEVGTFTAGQGQRNDLLGMAAAIQGGMPLQQLVLNFPQETLKYPSGTKLHYAARPIKRRLDFDPLVHVYWGPTGTGKTRRAFAECRQKAGDAYFVKGNDTFQWWDGYEGQKYVIFDEFAGSIPITTLLGILDRNEMKLQVKGGTVQLLAHEFWFTSNLDPKDWYPNCTQDQQLALNRRLKHVENMLVKRESNSNGGGEQVIVVDSDDEETLEDRCERLRTAGQLTYYMMRNDLNEAEQAECATMLIDQWRARKQLEWEQRIDQMMAEWYNNPDNNVEFLN